jgi:tungstate transport system permease protein
MDFILAGFHKAIALILQGDPETFSAVKVTLLLSVYSMAVSLALGIPAGFILGYTRFKGRKTIRFIMDTLMSLPTVLIGLLVFAFISRNGPLGHLELLFTIPGMAIGQAILAFPVVAALSASAVESMDAHLRPTLMSLGASRQQLFFSSLAEVRFGLLSAALAAYGRVTTEVGISMMVGGNIKWHTRTITTAIALETGKGSFENGIALGIILLLIAFSVNLSLSFIRKKQ